VQKSLLYNPDSTSKTNDRFNRSTRLDFYSSIRLNSTPTSNDRLDWSTRSISGSTAQSFTPSHLQLCISTLILYVMFLCFVHILLMTFYYSILNMFLYCTTCARAWHCLLKATWLEHGSAVT